MRMDTLPQQCADDVCGRLARFVFAATRRTLSAEMKRPAEPQVTSHTVLSTALGAHESRELDRKVTNSSTLPVDREINPQFDTK
jgi:hypothetical protein